MSERDDIEWLRELNEDLWLREDDGTFRPKHKVSRELAKAEWERVKQAIVEHKLVTEMVRTNMFGGVGVRVYQHPIMPGDDHEHVLTLTQEQLPGPTRQDYLMDRDTEEPDYRKPTKGSCSRAAYDIFAEFTHTEDNRRWLKDYGLKQPQDPGDYDY